MTGREFAGLVTLLVAGVVATAIFAPGGAVLALVLGTFAIVTVDHRVTARRSARAQLRSRLMAAARRHEAGRARR